MRFFTNQTPRSRYLKVLQWAIVATIFVFIGRMVWGNWAQVKEASFTFRPFGLIASTLLFVLFYFIQMTAWYLMTLKLGIAISVQETLRSWFYSQLGKYLPGKVWIFMGRFYFYESKGKSKKGITMALYFETVTMVMAAGLIFLVSFFFLREVRPLYFWRSPAWLIIVFILTLLCLHPRVIEKIINKILMHLKREPISISLSYSGVLTVLGVCILSWVIGGISFSIFVDSIFPVPPKYFLFLAGALAISSILGLVALFAPSGLGVREGILVYLLSYLMPGSVAAILSVLTRIWMTLIEIGLIGVIYLFGKFENELGKRKGCRN